MIKRWFFKNELIKWECHRECIEDILVHGGLTDEEEIKKLQKAHVEYTKIIDGLQVLVDGPTKNKYV